MPSTLVFVYAPHLAIPGERVHTYRTCAARGPGLVSLKSGHLKGIPIILIILRAFEWSTLPGRRWKSKLRPSAVGTSVK